jgi:hypothetical protein
MNVPTSEPGAPNCWQCQHFSVSWDPNLPYACRLMGFKSRITPALEVLRIDGVRCRGFATKAETTPAAASSDAEATVAGGNGLYSTFSRLA